MWPRLGGLVPGRIAPITNRWRPSPAKLVDHLAGEASRALVDLERPVLQAELAERDRRAAEAVGLDAIGPGGEVPGVDVADQLGLAEVQDLRAVLLSPIVIERQLLGLDAAAHGAVQEDDPVARGGQEIAHAATGTSWADKRWRIASGSSVRFSA